MPNVYELIDYLERCLVLSRDAYCRVDESLKRERAHRSKLDDRLRLLEQRIKRLEVGDLAKTIEGIQRGTVSQSGEELPF